METVFVWSKEDQIISISEVIPYPLDLFEPMIETGQVKVGEVLGEVVSDGKAICTVDNLFQEPEQVLILELPSQHPLQDGVIHRRIELRDIELKAVPGARFIPESLPDRLERPMDALSFDAGVSVSCEHRHEYWLQVIHYGMVDDPVRIVG